MEPRNEQSRFHYLCFQVCPAPKKLVKIHNRWNYLYEKCSTFILWWNDHLTNFLTSVMDEKFTFFWEDCVTKDLKMYNKKGYDQIKKELTMDQIQFVQHLLLHNIGCGKIWIKKARLVTTILSTAERRLSLTILMGQKNVKFDTILKMLNCLK